MDDVRLLGVNALLRLAIDVRRHIEVVAAGFDLTPPMARILLLLEEPMRMHAIAEAAACEPSHVTGLASQLEDSGLARRRADPDDGRARQLALTPEGERVRARLLPALLTDLPVMARLDDDGVRALLELIGDRPPADA